MTTAHLPLDSKARAIASLRASVALLATAVEMDGRELMPALAKLRQVEAELVRAVGEMAA